MSLPYKIAIVGVGKIARDQHMPSIENNPDFELAATVSRNATIDGVEAFADLEALLAARPDIGSLALCMPPQVRYEYAVKAMSAGRNVLLEKPPGATLSEVDALSSIAQKNNVSLFATWHSRFAPAVGKTKQMLADVKIKRLSISWKEDVRRWHPGQDWIWEAGGLGVFDPGINALSILTEIMPSPIHLKKAILEFPSNRDTPIAAELQFNDAGGADVSAIFDWRQEGIQSWNILIETDAGLVELLDGGGRLLVDGVLLSSEPNFEYGMIYQRFSHLLKTKSSDVDVAPLKHVADAFMLGHRVEVEPFEE